MLNAAVLTISLLFTQLRRKSVANQQFSELKNDHDDMLLKPPTAIDQSDWSQRAILRALYQASWIILVRHVFSFSDFSCCFHTCSVFLGSMSTRNNYLLVSLASGSVYCKICFQNLLPKSLRKNFLFLELFYFYHKHLFIFSSIVFLLFQVVAANDDIFTTEEDLEEWDVWDFDLDLVYQDKTLNDTNITHTHTDTVYCMIVL